MYSGITSGRVLDGELLYTEILEVNLFAFAYKLFNGRFLFNRRDVDLCVLLEMYYLSTEIWMRQDKNTT